MNGYNDDPSGVIKQIDGASVVSFIKQSRNLGSSSNNDPSPNKESSVSIKVECTLAFDRSTL